MQKEEYLIKNACYSVTKYYLCKRNNKRSFLGRKQRSQVAHSFLNRYQFSLCNKVTLLFSNSCILEIILWCNLRHFIVSFDLFWRVKRGRLHAYLPQIIKQHRAGQIALCIICPRLSFAFTE